MMRTTTYIIMAAFYAAYFAKMMLQRSRGIRTDQMARGTKPRSLRCQELTMKSATYLIVPVEIASMYMDLHTPCLPVRIAGLSIASIGVVVFIMAMATMRDSWRAGIPSGDSTRLVTGGIYRISRNPAFLGFDLMYIGILAAWPNIWHAAFCIFAVVMLHRQILQEEPFLEATFGNEYREYRNKVRRYI